MKPNHPDRFEVLRKKAEELIKYQGIPFQGYVPGEFEKLLHDLQVHQIELELQNEELKNTQKQLEESMSRYATLFNQAPVGYLSIDYRSIIIQANETFARMAGRSVPDLVGKSLGEFFTPDDRKIFRGRFNAFFKAPQGKSMELQIKPLHGRSYPVRLTGSIEGRNDPGSYDEPQHQRLLLIISDIRIQRETENALRRTEQELRQIIAEKDKFFSIIAHDLRGPFTSFLGFTELMAEDDGSYTQEEFRTFAGLMRKTAVNLFNLLENLLEWSRLQQGTIQFQPVPLQLGTLALQAMEQVRMQAERKEISLSGKFEDNDTVVADERMVETSLRNILANAVKFTPRGGAVEVSTGNIDRHCFVRVSDKGVGMSADVVSKLFLINEQVNSKGTEGEASTGLGLILCREFIVKNNGTIDVVSEPGSGTTFTVKFPCAGT